MSSESKRSRITVEPKVIDCPYNYNDRSCLTDPPSTERSDNAFRLLVHCIRTGDANGLIREIVDRGLTNLDNIAYMKNYGTTGAIYIEATPFQLACEHGDLSIVELLLNAGVDINVHDTFNVTPIHILCRDANVNHRYTIQRLIERVARRKRDPITTVDYQNNSPLHYACQHGDFGVIKLLFDLEVENTRNCILLRNVHGNCPLLLAAYSGNVESVLYLLERLIRYSPTGKFTYPREYVWKDAFVHKVIDRVGEDADQIEQSNDPVNTIRDKKMDVLVIISNILSKCYDLYGIDHRFGCTPFQYAVMRDNVLLASYFSRVAVYENATDGSIFDINYREIRYGYTVLALAAAFGNPSMVSVVLGSKGRIDINLRFILTSATSLLDVTSIYQQPSVMETTYNKRTYAYNVGPIAYDTSVLNTAPSTVTIIDILMNNHQTLGEDLIVQIIQKYKGQIIWTTEDLERYKLKALGFGLHLVSNELPQRSIFQIHEI